MEAVVTKHEHEERGVRMQSFHYAPALDEMCHILRIHSPRAYESLSNHLPMRSTRSFRCITLFIYVSPSGDSDLPYVIRMKEARQPRFPMEICNQTFKLVADHLVALNYTGPVGLSCDDTKLFSSLRLYWDSDENSYFLVGGADGPYRVPDADSVRDVIAQGTIRKVTKVWRFQTSTSSSLTQGFKQVRMWCLTIPVPKVAPIIVATVPIANDLDAETLFGYLQKVLNGLIDHGIQVISYACDGTEVERSVQRLLIEKAEKIEHVIKNPRAGGPDTNITIVKY